ncbi:hypothetical protein [Sandarakinorhabdus sp. DWP1-3-1]|uniref:hypothetical protein n=1 Tax=Sandarakinorhabdus sp. DWP1-3-1 TaxID=2804627 RepID=UPI003CEF39F1
MASRGAATQGTIGRPQRALAWLGLILALGLSARLPALMADAGATLVALRPRLPVPVAEPPVEFAATAPPTLLAIAAPSLPPPPPLLARPAPAAPGASVLAMPALAYSLPAASPAATAAAATTLPAIPAPDPASPGALATAAYARLAADDRRAAARLFDAALVAGPDPRAGQWQRDRRALSRRWSADAYALLRDGGIAGPAASPVLGGGQSGVSLAWTLDPLARRPLAIVARSNAANDDPQSAQAALGLRWRPLPGISIAAERLFAIGSTARSDWTLRIAAGADGQRGRLRWRGYGEAGVLGNGDIYTGGQARTVLPLARFGPADLAIGPAGWASLQTGDFTTGRFDLGPTIVATTPVAGFAVEVSADWRFRVAGNADPGSGPALTVSTRF